MKKWIVRIGLGILGLAALLLVGVWLAAALGTGPGDRVTPSGHRRNEALYLPMRDGVRIAVDVIYPDRREEDEKLLTYDSAPLEGDIEITGMPVVTLRLSSTATDGSLHVYLEDVAPEGRVTYLTEGIFRAVNRSVSSETPPYRQFGPYHTFRAEDASPLVPGEVA